MFGIFLSFGLLIGIAVGGIATLSGAIYGAIFLQFIFVVVGAGAQALQTWNLYLLYGLVLIVFLAFNPRGVAGLIDRTWVSMRRRFGARC
jgi:branched-chain amino acid transport system permease protein